MTENCVIVSPIGNLLIECDNDDDTIVKIAITSEKICSSDNPTLKKCEEQINNFLYGRIKKIDVKFKITKGTPFQQAVWREALNIPYGTTTTYLKLAERVATSKHSRAVGMALARNPILMIIPCHRIIGASGDLTGFNAGIIAKKYLINNEKRGTK